ncbi:MAG: hypothetical protein IKZ90_06600 [Clostridiales bacterium]|jgi:hypothetical protein|nr:hypothetical protein [Clostridiales bacterium]
MIKYVIGGAIVGGFIGLVAFLSQADKKASKKIDDQFAAEHHVKDSYGMYMITEEGEFAFPLKSGTLSGYKIWNLADVAFVATYKNTFSLLDVGQKAMKGDYLTPSKKPLKEKGYKTFTVPVGQSVDEVADLITRNAANVQRMQGGKIK